MEPTIVSVDNSNTLIPFCPDPEEIKIVSTYDGELEYLDQVIIKYKYI